MSKTLSGKEILEALINKGLVHMVIPGRYILTGEVDNAIKSLDRGTSNLEITIPAVEKLDGLFPKEIREAAPDKKIPAIYNYCNIPSSISRNGRRYMVRSNDVSTRGYLLKFIAQPGINPEVMLNCIKDYYKLMEYPKAMKNFVGDGDFKDLYDEYLQGKNLYAGGKRDNKQWR